MPLKYLPQAAYVTLPWKTGRGVTEEICLLPPGCDRDSFDLRVSRATIAEPGLFSAFPGADRVITVIEGHGLTLNFSGREVTLAPLEPYHFDTGLTPDGVPQGGGVRVLNVMAARHKMRIGRAEIVTGPTLITANPEDRRVVFAVACAWHVATGGPALTIQPGDTLLTDETAEISPLGQGQALVVPLSPAGSL